MCLGECVCVCLCVCTSGVPQTNITEGFESVFPSHAIKGTPVVHGHTDTHGNCVPDSLVYLVQSDDHISDLLLYQTFPKIVECHHSALFMDIALSFSLAVLCNGS